MSNRLKAGVVISQRINPTDCMSVVDVLGKTGILMEGMSFSAMCSLALSSLLETMRQQGHIPRRTGFEFTDLVGPYLSGKNAKRIHTAKAIEAIGSDFSAPALPTKEAGRSHNYQPIQSLQPAVQPEGLEYKQAARRLTELLQKKDLAVQQRSGVLWQEEDQREFDQCYAIVYPDG